MDGHKATAYTELAQRRQVKSWHAVGSDGVEADDRSVCSRGGKMLLVAAAAKPGRCDIHLVTSNLAVSYTSLCA